MLIGAVVIVVDDESPRLGITKIYFPSGGVFVPSANVYVPETVNADNDAFSKLGLGQRLVAIITPFLDKVLVEAPADPVHALDKPFTNRTPPPGAGNPVDTDDSTPYANGSGARRSRAIPFMKPMKVSPGMSIFRILTSRQVVPRSVSTTQRTRSSVEAMALSSLTACSTSPGVSPRYERVAVNPAPVLQSVPGSKSPCA